MESTDSTIESMDPIWNPWIMPRTANAILPLTESISSYKSSCHKSRQLDIIIVIIYYFIIMRTNPLDLSSTLSTCYCSPLDGNVVAASGASSSIITVNGNGHPPITSNCQGSVESMNKAVQQIIQNFENKVTTACRCQPGNCDGAKCGCKLKGIPCSSCCSCGGNCNNHM